jgi:hypothetical protein
MLGISGKRYTYEVLELYGQGLYMVEWEDER